MNKRLLDLNDEFKKSASRYVDLLVYAGQQGAKELYAIHNLYEIEPFFAQLSGDVPANPSFLMEGDEYDPEQDDLYMYMVHLEQRKIYQKRLLLGINVYYDTFFVYAEEYYESVTIYVNNDIKMPIEVSYLYFHNGLPSQYLHCNEYGITVKDYLTYDETLSGYKAWFYNVHKTLECTHKTDVSFVYSEDGSLDRIHEISGDKQLLIFKKFSDDVTLQKVLTSIEEYLSEEIYKQLVSCVRIAESVYCILLEYSMQGPFPPTVAIGLERERNSIIKQHSEWYNAPDMHYFSEYGTLTIDLLGDSIQEEYLYVRNILKNNSLNADQLASMIFSIYCNVCKRLMQKDFSISFPVTQDFLALARDYEACNEEDYYRALYSFKLCLNHSN